MASQALEEQLAEVPFEDLQRLRSQGHGTGGPRQWGQGRGGGGKSQKRDSKHSPMEMSSKKPVPRLREVIQVPKNTHRDPRFESLCGDFDEARFKNSYGFLYRETMPQEAEKLKKAVKKEKDADRRSELKDRLKGIELSLREEGRRRHKEEEHSKHNLEQKERAEEGKQPFFVSKSKRKREDLIEKFKELKEQGKLESFLAKRRKKNATKEHTKVPRERR